MFSIILQMLLNGVGGVSSLFVFSRIATGLFFVISGYHKLTNAKRRAVLIETLEVCNIPFIPVMRWFVPGVEFFGGLGVTFGLLTPLAAFGLAVICAFAACTDGIRRVRGWAAIDTADQIDDLLYLPEVLYILLLGMFVTNGAGQFSLDRMLSHLL
jgi:uncharacterized membrane protein YphA (DoxX/SURF4 family)